MIDKGKSVRQSDAFLIINIASLDPAAFEKLGLYNLEMLQLQNPLLFAAHYCDSVQSFVHIVTWPESKVPKGNKYTQ